MCMLGVDAAMTRATSDDPCSSASLAECIINCERPKENETIVKTARAVGRERWTANRNWPPKKPTPLEVCRLSALQSLSLALHHDMIERDMAGSIGSTSYSQTIREHVYKTALYTGCTSLHSDSRPVLSIPSSLPTDAVTLNTHTPSVPRSLSAFS
jgi:hypothetical protein